MIEDRSRNGTFVNGKKLEGVEPLTVPALIIIGSHQVNVLPPEGTGADRLQTEEAAANRTLSGGPLTEGRYQAFLVVDTVDTTGSEAAHTAALGRVTLALGRRLEKSVGDESEAYLRRTADGFIACFSTVDRALAASLRLAPAVARYLPATFQLAVALHWGTARLTSDGGRIGDDVKTVFALSQLRHEQPGLFSEPELQQTSEVVLMTEAFYSKLTKRLQPMASPVGPFVLDGLAQPSMVHLVSWKSVVASRGKTITTTTTTIR
jgi:hypothetical protein